MGADRHYVWHAASVLGVPIADAFNLIDDDRALPGIQPTLDRGRARPLVWVLGGAALIAVLGGAALIAVLVVGAGVLRYDSAQWLGEMTSGQQFAASADLLTAARNKGDEGTRLPSDALIDEFGAGISMDCVVPEMSLTEVDATLY